MVNAIPENESIDSSSIQPTWKNAPSRDDLYADYSASETSQDYLRTKLTEWEVTRDGGTIPKKVRKGRSIARPKVVRELNEWKYPALSEPILGTKDLFSVKPVGSEDVDAAKQNSLILNNQWSTKINRTKLVDDVVRTVVDEGTVIVKTGWNSVEGTKLVETEQPVYASPEESFAMIQQAVQSGSMDEEQAKAILSSGEPMQVGTEIVYLPEDTLVENCPSYEVCITANVTIDPTCDGEMENAMFVIHDYETSYAELKLDEYYKDPETGEEFGFYYNLNEVTFESEDATYDEYRSPEANSFTFADKPRMKVTAQEYWGYWDTQGDGVLVSIIATWIGDTMIRLEENPFPHGRPPFSVATYMPVRKSVYGEPDAEILAENQDSIGRMTRAIHDVTAKQAVGQEFIDENFFPSPSQKNAYEKGNTVYYRSQMDPKRAIWKNATQEIGQTPFNIIAWQEKKAAEMTGTVGLSGTNNGNKLNGNTAQRDAMDPASKRELSVLRRISAMLVDMARMTIAMNQVFLSEKEVVRITGNEFVTIARDDLEGNFDLAVDVSTPEKDEDQATKIMKLMQTNAANMDPEIAKMHYVAMAELWKLPTLANAVKEYQPQPPPPNPIQEMLDQLAIQKAQLENDVLRKEMEDIDSKIFERLSRTENNLKSDATLKEAKAEQAIATAEKLSAETDVIDQEFLNVETGQARQEDLEDRELDAVYKERDQISQTNKDIKLVL